MKGKIYVNTIGRWFNVDGVSVNPTKGGRISLLVKLGKGGVAFVFVSLINEAWLL